MKPIRINTGYGILTFIHFSIVGLIAILTAYAEYHIVIAILFVACLSFIVIIKKQYILYYFLLFGALLPPGLFDNLGGIVSLVWARNSILAIILLIYLIALLGKYSKALKEPGVRGWVIIITVWTVYMGVSSLWSLSPIDAMRYYPKFLFAACLGFVLMLDNTIDRERALDLLLTGGLIFLVISTLAEPFKSIIWPSYHGTPYFMGLISRHQSKFVLVFLFLLGLCNWITKRKKTISMVIMIWSTILLAFIVQRGAFLALGVGIIAIYLLSSAAFNTKLVFRGIIYLTIIYFIIIYIFSTPDFQKNMFYPGHGPEDLIFYLLQGDFGGAIDIINFKGRWGLWGLIQGESSISLFGIGLGSTSVLIGKYYGQLNQLHSDWIQYFYEGGIIGFIIYCAMWISCLKVSINLRKSDDLITKTLALCLGGYTVAIIFWSLTGHVLDYGHLTSAYLYAVAGLSLRGILNNKQTELIKTYHLSIK